MQARTNEPIFIWSVSERSVRYIQKNADLSSQLHTSMIMQLIKSRLHDATCMSEILPLIDYIETTIAEHKDTPFSIRSGARSEGCRDKQNPIPDERTCGQTRLNFA